MQRINRPHPTTSHRRQRGITLIESLVALVISVLGIIGILGMQMRTLVDSQTATRRAQAVRLIEDLSERMRVHPNARDGLMRYMPAGTTIVSDFDDTPDPQDCSGNHPSCVLFANELATWKKESVENKNTCIIETKRLPAGAYVILIETADKRIQKIVRVMR